MTGPAKDYVKGSINNRPFRPGGLDNSQASERILPDGASNGEWVRKVINSGPPQFIPPGFKDGLDLGDLKAHSYSWNVYNDQNAVKSTFVEKLAIYYLEKGESVFLWQLTHQLGKQLLQNMHLLWHQNTVQELYILLQLKPSETKSNKFLWEI